MINRRFFVGLVAQTGAVVLGACTSRRFNPEGGAKESRRGPYGSGRPYGYGRSTYGSYGGAGYGYGGWSYGGAGYGYGGWSYGGAGYGYGGWSYGGAGYGYGAFGFRPSALPQAIGEARLTETRLNASRMALELLGGAGTPASGVPSLPATFAEFLST